MWVLCCGMHRSGSTLQYQIVTKVAQFHPNAHILGWVEGQLEEQSRELLDSPDVLYIAKLHNYDPMVAEFWAEHHPKAIYIYRDIRDVVVSTMHMQSWVFDSLEMTSRVNEVLQNDLHWTRQPGILVSRYEDVMAEGGVAAEVRRIADYVGVSLAAEQIDDIAQSVSFKENKRYIEQFDYENKGIQYARTSMDPQSLLHNKHLRSGASGQWQQELSAEEIALIETLTGDWLVGRGYSLSRPLSDAEKAEILRGLFAKVLPQVAHLLREHSGVQAYIKEVEQSLAEEGAPEPSQTLQRQVHQLKAQIKQARGRKIARLMSKLGRPII